jgi:hypothetical protein
LSVERAPTIGGCGKTLILKVVDATAVGEADATIVTVTVPSRSAVKRPV